MIAQLEKKIAGLDLDKEMEAEAGPTKGTIKVGSSERKVASAKRSTEEGKEKKKEA